MNKQSAVSDVLAMSQAMLYVTGVSSKNHMYDHVSCIIWSVLHSYYNW